MNGPHPKFGRRLTQLMDEYGIGPEGLAEHLQCSRSIVCHWRAGRSEPKLIEIERMAALFGVTCDYLISGSEAPSSAQLRQIELCVTRALRAYALEMGRADRMDVEELSR